MATLDPTQITNVEHWLIDKLTGLGVIALEVSEQLDTQQTKVAYWMENGTAYEVVVTKQMLEDHGPDILVTMIKQNLDIKDPLQGGILTPKQSQAFIEKLIETPTLFKNPAPIKTLNKPLGKVAVEPSDDYKSVDWFQSQLSPVFGVDMASGPDQTALTAAAVKQAADEFKEQNVYIEGLGNVPEMNFDGLPEYVAKMDSPTDKDVFSHLAQGIASKLDDDLLNILSQENANPVTEKDPPPELQSKAITEAPKMATSQVDTMRYQTTQRPGMMMRDMSANKCVFMGSIISDFKKNKGATHPEADALSFYLLNHAVAEVRRRTHPDEPLRDHSWIFNKYHETLRDAGLRLAYYLFLICTREARHIRNPSNDAFLNGLYEDYPQSVHWIRQLPSGSGAAAQKFMNDPPTTTIGDYTACLVEVFNGGNWSSSFGGKKWGKVAQALHDYVRGELSMELLLDMGFALAHNGGPIFNKQVLYHHQDNQELLRILDVQRAGMIPQLICSGQSTKITIEHQDLWKGLHAILGTCMEGQVDWSWVTECGAVSKGHTVKVESTHTYGVSPAPKANIFANPDVTMGKTVHLKKTVKGSIGKGPHYTKVEGAPLGAFFVMPGLIVNKVKKERKK